ncbi:centrosomal protein of 68 kDa isoform X2 [Etheostoma spectabile]|uniref:centrosomal protein of 68 kDa isoform X2 n=1 Tax=Etheostoma spectabile TaxID=54343 RepID=UPI0013AF6BD1|nr:centrosomal protein of 68 kDa isoform X2 [Etheostoma spectabile]
MEAKGCSQRWKMHLPEFRPSRRSPNPTTEDSERGRTGRVRDGGRPHKNVSVAPTSRYLSDRQYVMRKPLFSAEQHASILKKTQPQKHTEKENQLGVSTSEENQQPRELHFSSRPGEELTPESYSLSHSDLSRPAASRKDLRSPSGVSELRTRLCHEEPSLGSSFPGSRSAQWSFLNSSLEVQRPNPPLRPQLTSTVLYPTYTPRSGYSRPGQTQLRMGGGERRGKEETKLCSSRGHKRGHPMSPHQANYWACAIPKALPPSPDRNSASWDPNREYQALLDYTYPLRPGQVLCEGDSSKLQEDSLFQTYPNLEDSGIELDHHCSSTSLSGLDFSFSVGHKSPESPDGPPSGALLYQTDPGALSFDSLDDSKDRDEINFYKCDGRHHQHHALSSSSTALPRPRCGCGEVDEEFRPLPEQLEELQLLSRQVREVTAQLSRPATASWESLEPGTTSVLSSITLPGKQKAEVKDLEDSSQDTGEGKQKTGREERSAAHTADRRDFEAVRRSSGAWGESVGGGLSPSSLREVEVLVEQLCGLTLPGNKRGSQEDPEQSDSLMQHIQVFCSHLEQLIKQLYTMSEKMELLCAPTVDIDSVKSSLAEYQGFQREVSSQQPLTSCVLHTGQLLLRCINTMSPLLRDTLVLIERQRGSLETHTEHLFSSILAAMDSLTQPSPVQQNKEEDPDPVGVRGSTL